MNASTESRPRESHAGQRNFGTNDGSSSSLLRQQGAFFDNDLEDEREEEEEAEEDEVPSFFVRALYDFTSADSSSLTFEAGAIIEVLTQLESGWWDGLLGNDVRGWFPSNYVEPITDEEAELELRSRAGESDLPGLRTMGRLTGAEMEADGAPGSRPAGFEDALSLSTTTYPDGGASSPFGLGLDGRFGNLADLLGGGMSDAFEQLAEAAMLDQPLRGGAEGEGTPDLALGRDAASAGIPFTDRSRRRSRLSESSYNTSASPSMRSTTDLSSVPSRSAAPSINDEVKGLGAFRSASPQVGPSDRERARAASISTAASRTHSGPLLLSGRPRAATGSTSASPLGPAVQLRERAASSASHAARMAEQKAIRKKRSESEFWVPKVTDRGEVSLEYCFSQC